MLFLLGRKNEIAGSYGNFTFSILRNCNIAFQNGRTIVRPTSSEWGRFLVLTSLPTLVIVCLAVTWYLMVLIDISIITDDIEHLLMYFLAIYVS